MSAYKKNCSAACLSEQRVDCTVLSSVFSHHIRGKPKSKSKQESLTVYVQNASK